MRTLFSVVIDEFVSILSKFAVDLSLSHTGLDVYSVQVVDNPCPRAIELAFA